MPTRPNQPRAAHLALANTFGTLGYVSLIMQWLWTCVIVGYPLFTQDKLSFFLPKPATATPPPVIEYGGFTPFITGIAIVFTLLVLAATIYALIRLPVTVGKKGSKLTHKTATVIAPTIAPKKLTKKQRTALIERITWWVKLVLILVPLIALLFASSETGLSNGVILVIGGFCAVWSGFCFLLQYLLGKALRLPEARLW